MVTRLALRGDSVENERGIGNVAVLIGVKLLILLETLIVRGQLSAEFGDEQATHEQRPQKDQDLEDDGDGDVFYPSLFIHRVTS